MRTVAGWIVAAVALVHGLIHLLGAAKGLGWAEVAQLTEPLSAPMGAAWLAAALVVLLAAVMVAIVAARGAPGKARSRTVPWWIVAAIAAIVSQTVIFTAWSDAAAGTAANAFLLLAAGYGYASQGPRSFRAEYDRRVATALAEPTADGIVTDADLAHLPAPVAAYVRQSGALGQPRMTSFRARIHGRIRHGAGKPWMPFVAEQVNTYGARTSRLFLMDATMFGLPVDVLHTFVGPDATMRAKVCSVVPVVDVSGPDMARAETVTLFNDLCVFAPGALVDAPITWQAIDDRHVLATYTNGAHTVTAELRFNERAELVDFVSDDRLAATADGKGFSPQGWSTPLWDYRTVGGHRVATAGEGRWHPAGEPPFAYVELQLDEVAYNLGGPQRPVGSREPAVHRSG